MRKSESESVYKSQERPLADLSRLFNVSVNTFASYGPTVLRSLPPLSCDSGRVFGQFGPRSRLSPFPPGPVRIAVRGLVAL